jgi:tetratricopeptide (TPR) repeat protein
VSEKFRAASLSELELPATAATPRWATVRHALGITAFGVNAWIGQEAGQEVIVEHDEVGPRSNRHEELYVVIAGHATFTVDGEEIDAPNGTFVFVKDPAAKRKAVAGEPETTILAVGATPGQAFEPSEWERSAPALGSFATGDYDKAYELMAEANREFPYDPAVLFNLACAESLLGRTDEAIEHLERSIKSDDRFRELAQNDTDFDAIRDDPRFTALVG